MRATIRTRYGAPEVLHLTELQKPKPRRDELLIRLGASTVTVVDCTFRQGDFWMARLFTGVLKPKHRVLGGDFSGVVEAVGDEVRDFQVGERVFGTTHDGFGAHAEYVCLPESKAVVRCPEGISDEEAASVVYGSLTALPFLRDVARLKPGQKIAINGASGSIGSMAVQLAKNMGAHVTGVCRTENVELVRLLGADEVFDYTTCDWTEGDELYDVIFDVVGKLSFPQCTERLTAKGHYMTTVPSLGILWWQRWTSLWDKKRATIAFTGLRPNAEIRADLGRVRGWLEGGELHPVVDRSFPLEQIAAAHAYVESGRKRGNVVVSMA